MTTPTTDVVNVTPALAAEWLAECNTSNRALREVKVSSYARDMQAGAWRFNGDTIRFAVDGTLLDGQHRLAAIVRANIAIDCIVVRGLEPEAQDTMDIGAHRALRDQLMLRGEANARELSAIARRALMVERGTIGGGGSWSPTHAEMIAYIDANPDLRRAAEVAARVTGRIPAAPSSIGTAFHLSARVCAENAEMFYLTQVIDGLGLKQDDPAYVLRARLQREVALTGRQMTPDDIYRYTVTAWNHFRAGRRVSRLIAPRGGWAAAPIPMPQ